jgi:hypothetical protein
MLAEPLKLAEKDDTHGLLPLGSAVPEDAEMDRIANRVLNPNLSDLSLGRWGWRQDPKECGPLTCVEEAGEVRFLLKQNLVIHLPNDLSFLDCRRTVMNLERRPSFIDRGGPEERGCSIGADSTPS